MLVEFKSASTFAFRAGHDAEYETRDAVLFLLSALWERKKGKKQSKARTML